MPGLIPNQFNPAIVCFSFFRRVARKWCIHLGFLGQKTAKVNGMIVEPLADVWRGKCTT